MSLEKVQETKRLTLEDIAPHWAKFLSESGHHPPSMPIKMSDYRYCIVGEAWGFRGIYMYSGSGANPCHCPRCIDLSREISDAYYLSLEESKDLGDAISAFVDHWNEKHREKAPINLAT
jgi:hypothetical protein